MSCGVGHRHGLVPVLLWLSCRLAATARIGPLTWETDAGVVLKSKKKGGGWGGGRIQLVMILFLSKNLPMVEIK